MEHWRFLWQNLPNLLFGFPGQRPGGLLLSILLALIALGLGFFLAIIIGGGRHHPKRRWRWPSIVYIEVFRGLPLILLLFLIHQGLGGRRFGLTLSPYQSALIALTLYTAAYQAEIIRSGLQRVPQQLIDSAKVLGQSNIQIYWQIQLRYTLKVMLPAFTGQAISLFKDTSVVIVLGVGELLTVARMVLGSDVSNTHYWVSLYLFVGVLYMSIALIVSNLAKHWERQQKNTDLVYSLANA